ncbi:hypothetical protein HAX54_042279 [Datura stramonium]|uniref:Uncharacterized protein n=1 Tax=Datura stramonium TaxID=4076 RepID=A0ABS8VYW3_DATST|nr:hypothetical protein [Datura stramonium]
MVGLTFRHASDGGVDDRRWTMDYHLYRRGLHSSFSLLSDGGSNGPSSVRGWMTVHQQVTARYPRSLFGTKFWANLFKPDNGDDNHQASDGPSSVLLDALQLLGLSELKLFPR